MTDVDAVASAVVTGKGADNPSAATPAQSTDAKGAASPDPWGTADDGLRKTIEAKGWKAPADVVKSYVELEKYASKTVQDMTPEEREKFVKRLGRPESPDAYELSNVTLPDGMQRTKEADKEFREVVWKMHALPYKEQAKALHEWAMKKAAEGIVAQKAMQAKAIEENESHLRKAWGLDFEANMVLSDKAAKLGGDEFVQWLNSGPGKLAVVRRALHNIGQLVSDDTLVTGAPVPKNGDNSKGLLFDPVKMGLRTGTPTTR